MPTKDFTHKPATGVGHGDNVAILGQAFGSPVGGHALANAPSLDGTIRPAGLFSTAPFIQRPPTGKTVALFKIEAIREDITVDERYGKCYGKDDTCTAWGTRKYNGLCNAHGRMAMGLSSYSPKGGEDGRPGTP